MTFKQSFKQKRRRFQRWLLPALGYPVLWLLSATQRFKVEDPTGHLARWRAGAGGAQVIVFWHDELLLAPWAYRRFMNNRPASVMISQNLSGEVIAVIAKKFGLDSARGSQSKGGREACSELEAVLKNGGMAAITPDGSRGPRHHLKSGVFRLARSGQAAVVPIRFGHQWRFCLPTWDRFQVPLPFSRVTLTLMPAIAWDDPELEKKLTAALGGV